MYGRVHQKVCINPCNVLWMSHFDYKSSHSFIWWMSHLWLGLVKSCFNEKSLWWKAIEFRTEKVIKIKFWRRQFGGNSNDVCYIYKIEIALSCLKIWQKCASSPRRQCSAKNKQQVVNYPKDHQSIVIVLIFLLPNRQSIMMAVSKLTCTIVV